MTPNQDKEILLNLDFRSKKDVDVDITNMIDWPRNEACQSSA
jgi:hypothetical protein